jgi:hypothetical protein
MKTFFNQTFLMLSLLSLILTSSCEKEEDIQSKLDKLNGVGYFPMQVGNYWKFTDLPKTEIDAIEIINGKEYFRFITQNDTAYYRKSDDDKIFCFTKTNDEVLIYDLSAEVGQIWAKVINSTDSSYVKLSSINDTIETNSSVFHDCYRYFSDGYDQRIIDNESSTWLAPNIGMIQISGGIGIKRLEEVQIDGIKIKF